MLIAIPKELVPGEHRVALLPQSLKKFVHLKIKVLVESGAGLKAGFSDADYQAAGAEICVDAQTIAQKADIICRVNALAPTTFVQELNYLRAGMMYIGLSSPNAALSNFAGLAQKSVTGFALERLPRISRAQSMDVLSSQANLAGYKAALLGVNELAHVVPMLITAAGTIQPAKVLVLGAGVAGLQAIATAKRLGAVVYGFDVRSAVREQIESLGAKFVDIKIDAQAEAQGGYAKELGDDAQIHLQKKLGEFAANMDLIICTAQIPGKKAPLLITHQSIAAMKKGAVIVDLAAATGGNTAATIADEKVQKNGVSIFGPSNVPSLVAADASLLFAHNLIAFLGLMIKDGQVSLDFSDEIIKATCFCHKGELYI